MFNETYVNDEMERERQKYKDIISTLISTIVVLVFLLVLSVSIHLKTFEKLSVMTAEISQAGAENVELQTTLEYYQEYAEYLENKLQ